MLLCLIRLSYLCHIVQSRRNFLASGLGVFAALAMRQRGLANPLRGNCVDTGGVPLDLSCPQQFVPAAPDSINIEGLPFARWYTGDTFPGLEHPMPNPDCFSGRSLPIDEVVDVAVIGGGISGLSAAYMLRDFNPILFEFYPQCGGSARGEIWNGVPYSLGNAYVITPDPGTFLESFYTELGMNDVVRVDSHQPPVELNGDILEDFFDGQGVPPGVAAAIARYREIVQVMAHDEYPDIPLPGGDDQWILDLDTKTFRQDIEDRMKMEIPDLLAGAIQAYCYSSFSAGWEEISAASGWNFLAAEEFGRWVCPGGNSYMAKQMWESLRALDDQVPAWCRPYHVRGGCRVVDVRQTPFGRMQVTWVGADGQCRALEAKKVVMACPKMIAKHVIHDIGDIDPQKYDAMASLKYRAYLVVNVLLDQPIERDFYDIFLLGDGDFPMDEKEAQSQSAVCDMLSGHFARGKSGLANSNVLTLYWPLPFDYARWTLYIESGWEDYARALAPQVRNMLKMLNVPESAIQQIRMTRWGHALPVSSPGLIAGGVCDELRRPMNERIYFCHQDNWALPAVENCLLDAKTFTDEIRDGL